MTFAPDLKVKAIHLLRETVVDLSFLKLAKNIFDRFGRKKKFYKSSGF